MSKVKLKEIEAISHIDLAVKIAKFFMDDKEREMITIIVTSIYPEVIASIAYKDNK